MPSRSVDDLIPQARKECLLWIEECTARNLHVKIICTLRTPEEQAELYAQGRTKPGPIVTNTLASKHVEGTAWDFCMIVDGKVNWDAPNYEPAAAVAKELGLNAGYYWKMRDCPHIQLRSWPA